ncbi:hypothetical protein [Mycobacterium hubeiense]|uniref:hypothetical protein n=1 Tax=Mycobacterium hubeiense TaxID=1867256 RepID=UPI001E29F3E4|nr:hypothetical protein [Mycobacterium sp. QGD 101]
MSEVPVTGALAEYRGQRIPILFGGDDWVALPTETGIEMPDAFAYGESRVGPGHYQPWAKVPMSALDGVIDVVVSGRLEGHTVSLRRRLPDGRIVVEFVGPPSVAKALGLEGDQYMGWTGLVALEELKDISVEETRRA